MKTKKQHVDGIIEIVYNNYTNLEKYKCIKYYPFNFLYSKRYCFLMQQMY